MGLRNEICIRIRKKHIRIGNKFDFVEGVTFNSGIKLRIPSRHPRKTEKRFMIAFVTCKSNSVPLLEGLCSSNPCRCEFPVFAGSEPTTSGLTVPRSDQLS